MVTLNFICHPDDDFLLFNPDIAQDILDGHTVHLYYMTDGDDGRSDEYCLRKENALISTYYEQFPQGDMWIHFMYVRSNSFRTGDTLGDLYRMWHDSNYIAPVHPTSGQHCTKTELLKELKMVIEMHRPDLIRIHNPYSDPAIDHDEPSLDHLDHIYSAKFVMEAAPRDIPIEAYMGYQLRYIEPNLTPEQTDLKRKLWRAYQAHEPEVAGEQWDVVMDKQYKMRIQ